MALFIDPSLSSAIGVCANQELYSNTNKTLTQIVFVIDKYVAITF
jgi:hypothetical protein